MVDHENGLWVDGTTHRELYFDSACLILKLCLWIWCETLIQNDSYLKVCFWNFECRFNHLWIRKVCYLSTPFKYTLICNITLMSSFWILDFFVLIFDSLKLTYSLYYTQKENLLLTSNCRWMNWIKGQRSTSCISNSIT